MAQLTLQRAYELAMQHHQAGRLHEAERLYRLILEQQPEHAESMHHLGVLAHQAGRNEMALDLIRRALALRPDNAQAHYNLGIVFKSTGQLDEAIAANRRAIALKPDYAQAFNNLGNALKEKGQVDAAIAAYRQAIAAQPAYAEALNNLGTALQIICQPDEAIAAYRQALALRPDYAEVHCNLGVTLESKGQVDEAIAAYRLAVATRPAYADAHNNLGNALKTRGQIEDAIAAYQQAISLRPDYAEAFYNLGSALKAIGKSDDAITAYRRALALRPDYAQAHSNLGNALHEKGQFAEAVAAHRQALTVNPNYAEAHNNLGNALRDLRQLDDAIVAYRQAIALNPRDPRFDSNFVFALHFHPAYDAQTIADEHRRWDHQHAASLAASWQAHPNDRTPNRRLRIGYVSPDFRDHVVGRFLLPLLGQHDHRQFEVFCYSNGVRADAMTARLRAGADQWREIAGLNDEQAAAQIRRDAIDILVDLSGHTSGNRLLVFAHRPAPVQVSYLGYPGTTGLSAIDYRLTDSFADLPGLTDRFSTETLCRLPQCNWCFAAPQNAPPLEAPPSIRRGHITFGSFNNFAKVTEPMLEAWARILREVPGSRLLLKAAAFGAASACERARAHLAGQGIDAGRVELRAAAPDYASHLVQYRDMDIALDTFPYHGTTTTCDALWMGVAVVTLSGQSHVSRVGLSLLSNIGLPDLAAKTLDEYVGIAAALAQDPERLTKLRLTLRDRMIRSPLMDAATFTRDVEAAYRQMWRTWCETGAGGSRRE